MYTTQEIINRVIVDNGNAIRVINAENEALYAVFKVAAGDNYLELEGNE